MLIFHTSRFARNTIEAKRYKKMLRSESVHEIFDEYYSVSLSFWTKMGLREKARQGLLTGGLAWGLLKGEDGIAVPEVEKAPYVLRMFEMYATGQHTDRTIAEWLNVQEQRTTARCPRRRDARVKSSSTLRARSRSGIGSGASASSSAMVRPLSLR